MPYRLNIKEAVSNQQATLKKQSISTIRVSIFRRMEAYFRQPFHAFLTVSVRKS